MGPSTVWSGLLLLLLVAACVLATGAFTLGLNSRRLNVPACTLGHPTTCSPAEYEEICGRVAVEDPDLTEPERQSLENQCMYVCGLYTRRYDYCAFDACSLIYKHPAFVNCK
jgi:hypothetical protein